MVKYLSGHRWVHSEAVSPPCGCLEERSNETLPCTSNPPFCSFSLGGPRPHLGLCGSSSRLPFSRLRELKDDPFGVTDPNGIR